MDQLKPVALSTGTSWRSYATFTWLMICELLGSKIQCCSRDYHLVSTGRWWCPFWAAGHHDTATSWDVQKIWHYWCHEGTLPKLGSMVVPPVEIHRKTGEACGKKPCKALRSAVVVGRLGVLYLQSSGFLCSGMILEAQTGRMKPSQQSIETTRQPNHPTTGFTIGLTNHQTI